MPSSPAEGARHECLDLGLSERNRIGTELIDDPVEGFFRHLGCADPIARNAARRLGKEKLHRRATSLVRWRLQHAIDVELVAASIDHIRVMVPTVGGSRDRTGGEY